MSKHSHDQPVKSRVLNIFSLVMINVIAIDSLRNVPSAAEYGFSLIFYYLAAAFLFFIPCAMTSAELATGWPKDGGVYIWVREAFGRRFGLLAIWLQWAEGVIWFPTLMAFIASTLIFAINPQFADDKYYLFITMIALFWFATFLNLQGMQVSAYISEFCAVLGTIFPMLLIAGLGAFWLWKGRPSQIDFSLKTLIPNFSGLKELTYLTGILLSLVGIELSANYAQSIQNPQKNYPRAMLISVGIILATLMLSSLAIAIVIPKEKISLVHGLVEAFDAFFNAYGLSWMTTIIAVIIIIGGFGNAATWILGPNKGLLAASKDGNIPEIFKRTNVKGAPSALLIVQALIFTLLCSVFLFMPTVNSSYWILTALTTQLYMLMYFLMFIAVIRLRYTHPEVARAYKIPGGKWGVWCVAGLGIFASLSAIFIGFLPPQGFEYGSLKVYEGILIIGFLSLSLLPFIYSFVHERRWRWPGT